MSPAEDLLLRETFTDLMETRRQLDHYSLAAIEKIRQLEEEVASLRAQLS